MRYILFRIPEANRALIAAMLPFCVFLLIAGREIARGRFSAETAAVIMAPGSGEEVLPDKAREILAFVRDNDLKNYRLSCNLREDIYIHHRVTEGVWLDARPDDDSPYLFVEKNEIADYEYLKILGVSAHVVLLHTD